MPSVKAGETIPISLQLFDNDATKFVRATSEDESGTPLVGSPFSLPHDVNGLYKISSVLMPDTGAVVVQYEVFNEASFLNISAVHSSALDLFTILKIDPEDIAEAVWDVTLADHLDPGSTGEALNNIGSSVSVSLSGSEIVGILLDNTEVIGLLDDTTETEGIVEDSAEISGTVEDNTEVSGKLEDDSEIEGELED